MVEHTGSSEIGEQITIVDEWIDKLSREGVVDNLDIKTISTVLEHFGANFEIGEQLEDLSEYSNKAKAGAMRSIWGGRYDEYKMWVERWVQEFETTPGNQTLPKLDKSGSKTSGCIQFFGELTAYSAGKLEFDNFKRFIETRAINGRLWQEGKKDERLRVNVPSGKVIHPSSFPPEFPRAAWGKIKSFK